MDNDQVIAWWTTVQNMVAHVVCLVSRWYLIKRHSHKRKISYSLNSGREDNRNEIMNRIMNGETGRNIIRMGPPAFIRLVELLETKGGLRPTRWASVEEQVAKTLYILTHSAKNREVNFWFRRSGETISRHLHNVIKAIIQLEDTFLIQPDGTTIPSEIRESSRFFPYFKDCLGAIDGTHIRVKVAREDAPKYRGRKEYPTQNVLAACTFDLKFTYVLTGWEGTASDSRIIKDALTREDNLKIPSGKYYLVDAGFMLTKGLLTPYRGVRYHLKEYSSRNPPRDHRELFNLRHASLRNAIERAFGVLKKRFIIISNASDARYGMKAQNSIILACCILHNYLMCVDPDEDLIAEVDADLARQEVIYDEYSTQTTNSEDAVIVERFREEFSTTMWAEYQ